jgi:tRNA pseudouridine38-40 synthase
MQEAVVLFEGTKDFGLMPTSLMTRQTPFPTVSKCLIELNTLFTANFFPEESQVSRKW